MLLSEESDIWQQLKHIIYGIVLYKFVEKSGVNVVPLFVYKEMCSGDVGMVESN